MARDPNAAHGDPPKPLLPRCARCDHTAYIHSWSKEKQERTSCAQWYGGRCDCPGYVPKEET